MCYIYLVLQYKREGLATPFISVSAEHTEGTRLNMYFIHVCLFVAPTILLLYSVTILHGCNTVEGKQNNVLSVHYVCQER